MKNNIENPSFKDQVLEINEPNLFNQLCDNYFGYDYSLIESSITDPTAPPHLYLEETLDEQALNTSWYDYYQMILSSKNSDSHILDIGSGYSKGTLLALALGLDHFHSVELVPERISWAINKAKDLNLPVTNFNISNALDFNLKKFDTIFIYQPTGLFLSKLLDKAIEEGCKKIWAIESHGDLITRLDFDPRLINKKNYLNLTSIRHNTKLYSYTLEDLPLNSCLQFERSLYQERFIQYCDTNPIYGKFKWISTTKNTSIDYIEGKPTLEIRGKRINLEKELDNLSFINRLSDSQQKYLSVNLIKYDGIVQKILKVITFPDASLELSVSGRVTIED